MKLHAHRAFLALGSNLHSPERQVLAGFDEIAATPRVDLLARSSLYRTAPVGYEDQPDFINAVAEIRTSLAPGDLLQELLAIEASRGRVRDLANGPRTLDLDILIYDDLQVRTERLTLPHPRAHLRAFVLYPLLEIAPDAVLPGLGPARHWLSGVREQGIRRIAEEVTFRLALGSLVGAN